MQSIQRLSKSLKSFASSHAFSLLTILCICVIAATAVWSRRTPAPTVFSTPPVIDLPASYQLQQTLDEAEASQPSPQPAIYWHSPLDDLQPVRGFSATDMLLSENTGLWTVHTGLDLSASQGAPVYAMDSGRILAIVEDDACGTWVSIQHGDGYVSRYCSLHMTGAYQPGDVVDAGSVIGFVGSTYADEKDLGPHLHLEVYQNDTPIDPLLMLK